MESFSYEEAVEYLLSIPRFTKKNDMEHTRHFLAAVGNYPVAENVIHIAGTNGKGSVCAYLAGILQEAGFKVGMFTSPHLICINERFCINGIPVSDDAFLSAFLRIHEAIDELMGQGFAHPTFFECMVAMSSVIFEAEKVDYQIMETGLGGRLDATNVVEHPLATVITSIGLDHTEYLGDTLLEIAQEKAGIIKQGSPVIYDASGEASGVFKKRAEDLQTLGFSVEKKMCKNAIFTNKYIDFYFFYEYDKCVRLHLNTMASYQMMNVALAVKTILSTELKDAISVEQIAAGIARVHWSGRMEWVTENVLLDGAHNTEGMKQAVCSLMDNLPECKPILLFSAVREKNYKQMIDVLCRNIDFSAIIITELPLQRAAQVEVLAAEFGKYFDGRLYKEKNIGRALEKAVEIVTDNSFVFCTGSLYLIGELKKYLKGRQVEDD